jgi:diamine N-acetyltransferase
VTIREATADDMPQLAELAARTWVDEFGAFSSAEEVEAELEETRSPAYFEGALATDAILLAEESGRLVGYAQVGDGAFHRLYIVAECQGRGVGRALAVAALEHPRLRGAPRVSLQVWERNERAIRLYESLGFRIAGTTTFTIGGGEPVEDLVMVLEK